MSIAPISLSTLLTIPNVLPKVAVSTVTAKIITLVAKYFGLGQAVFFGLYGAKELVLDGVVQDFKLKPLGDNPTWFNKTVHKIRNFMAKVCQAHGSLYLLSATAMLISELDTLKILSLGSLKPGVDMASNIIFLGACSLAIGYELIILKEAINISRNGSDEEKKVTKLMIASSLMGIIGNIGYIAAVSNMMLGGATIASIILALIAVSIGCVKILFDYKFLKPAFAVDQL